MERAASQSEGIQSTMAGKAQRQDFEAAGHTSLAERKQRDACWCSAQCLLYLQSGTPVDRMVPATLRVGLARHGGTCL